MNPFADSILKLKITVFDTGCIKELQVLEYVEEKVRKTRTMANIGLVLTQDYKIRHIKLW